MKKHLKAHLTKNFLCIIMLIISGYTGKLSAETEIKQDSITIGAFGGKTDVHGYYKNKLSDGYNFGIFLDYSIFNSNYFFLETGLSYTELSLENNSLSKLSLYSLGLGPVICIPELRYIKPYAGLLATVNYLDLNAVSTRKTEKTVKAGLTAKAGLFIPVYKDISFNLGFKYSTNELSGKAFQNTTYLGGISYSYNFVSGEKAERSIKQIEIDDYYESGIKYFKTGDGIKAKEYFNKVTSYDKDYKDVKNYLGIIILNEDKFEKAEKFASENRFFEALPLLIDAEKYLIEANKKLNEVRTRLKEEENILVKNGIEAYNKEDYERCIFFMRRVQLINPENESANIYLPRAVIRYNALRKFE
ncbi:MAG: hypothetical protein V1874_09045 [Spirochaetota bacterium]